MEADAIDRGDLVGKHRPSLLSAHHVASAQGA
jgi:hypothetical protein